MIYLIHGTDEVKARRRFRAVVNSLVGKGKGYQLFSVGAEDQAGRLVELVGGASLFDAKYVIAGERLLEKVEFANLLSEQAKFIADSVHALVLLETKVESDVLKLLKKVAFKIEGFALDEKARQKFNIFKLTDAWAARNKRQTWLLFQQALRAGLTEEEIFWKLVWQTKYLLAVKTAVDKKSLGLHPFALEKASGYASKFTMGELQSRLASLSDVYHSVRRGEGELGTRVEQLILQK